MEGLTRQPRRRLRDRLLEAAMWLPLDVELKEASLRAWDRYVGAADLQVDRRLYAPDAQMLPDFASAGDTTRARLAKGEILIERVAAFETDGPSLAGPGTNVDHVRGAVLLRGADLDAVVRRLRLRPSPALPPEETVRLHGVYERPQATRLAVRVSAIEVAPVLYDAEFDVRVRRHGRGRAVVLSVATTVEELGLPMGRPSANWRRRGLLWRLGAFWCVERVPCGVLAGCEWLALRRELPWPLRVLARPALSEQASLTLERILRAFRREATMLATRDRPNEE